MKESKAVYVTRHKILDDQNIVYQLNTNWEREFRYDNYNKNNDFACQFDCKKDVCTCKNVYGREPIYFNKIPKQVYAYHGSRSFTDIGVGSVKALQRRKVKRVYLPETDDRGVGSSDLSGYSNIKRTRPYKGSYYDHKKTSSKCVGGIIEYNTGCVISEKLSPIVNTKSGTTSPKIPQGQKNIEIGSNTVVKKVETVGTQFEIDDKEEKDTPEKEEPKLEATSTEVSEPIQKYKNSSSIRKLDKKIKDAEKQFSSDSLVQHVHDLEMPSEEKPSRTSMDPMENKLEREYRRMFATKENDSKPSCDKPLPEFKSASILRRRFEALRRGLTKKDDLKKSSFIPKSSQSRDSSPSRKDASVTSDPPSLEGHSYSDAKRYSPIQADIIEQERPRKENRNERESMQYATEMDSDCQGVRGMFKLWGKKFNLEDDYYNKKQPTPMPSYIAPKESEKEIEKRENEQKKPEPEMKKEKRFFFFKKRPRAKPKNTYLEPSKNKVENVTAGRCEITDGLTLKMGRPSPSAPVPKEKTSKPSDEREEITRKRWLRRFLSKTIESARSVNVRWNNTTYATSSSTVFEIIDTVYKNREIFMRSHSEVTSVESYYRSNTKNKVNFIQDIEAWMIPKTIPDRPQELPVKICPKKDIPQKNIELSYFNQKWLIDQPKALSHKIEVKLHSKNLNIRRKVSSEYLRIDIPKDFFDDSSSDESKRNQTSDEEVYKVIEYETDTDFKKVNRNIRMEKGDNPQSDIKVIVSVQDSTNLDSKILETVIKRPPTQRDVIIQGSNVNIPKRCDVIGVGIITQNDLRVMRKPILKINVSSSEDSDPQPLLNQKKCEFAESYLQEYYKHWTPLGLDLYSCVSDSHLKSCSEKSLSVHNQQGDGSKSCPNICDDYQASTMMSSSETSSGSAYNQGNDKFDEKKSPKLVNFMKKKVKVKECNEKDDSGKRVLPKDSLEVFKKRKIYAQSNKCQWHCAEDKPVSVPSFESRGEQDYQDSRDGNGCHNDDRAKIQKSVLTDFKKKEIITDPNKNKICKKHVSMPDCEAVVYPPKKQCLETPASILNFKGSLGCDLCKKMIATGSKHASIKAEPVIKIPEPPCKVECLKQSNPACCLQPGLPSCNIPSKDILHPPPCRQTSVCPESPPTSKCSCLASSPSDSTSRPICPHVSEPPQKHRANCPPCPGQTASRLPPPKPCPISPCPSPPKISKSKCPHATASPLSSGENSPRCPSSLPPGQTACKLPPPKLTPTSPCPSPPKKSKPPCPRATASPLSSGENSPTCPASLSTCQKSSLPPPPIPCPMSPCPSMFKKSKPTCPHATESSSNSEGINPPCSATLPTPCQKQSRPPPPIPCPISPCPSLPKKSKPTCPHATESSSNSEGINPPCTTTLPPPCQKKSRPPPPKPCPISPCPSLPKKSKPTCPQATESSSNSEGINPPCSATLPPPCQKQSRPPPPKPCPISPCPSLPKKSKPTCPHVTESLSNSEGINPPCTATLPPPCQKQSRPPPPKPCPISPCPSLPKKSKPTCPYATESPSNSDGINPPCSATSPCQKQSQPPPPKPCSTSPCPSPPKNSKQKSSYATGFSLKNEETNPPCPAMKPDCRGVIPSCPSMVPQCPSKMAKLRRWLGSSPPCPASLPTCQQPIRTKKISNKGSEKKGLCPHCAEIEKAEKSASNNSCRGCIANKKKSKNIKKIECCSPPASSPISACPSMDQMSQCPSACLSMDQTSQCPSQYSPAVSPVSSAVPLGPGLSLSSEPHPPKPKPKPPPKLSKCRTPPCSKIQTKPSKVQTKPSKVDGKKPKFQQAGCGEEFPPPPPPMNTHCSNQSSPQTSEGCLSKIMNKIKDNKSECKENCSMMKLDSFLEPAPKNDDCKSLEPAPKKDDCKPLESAPKKDECKPLEPAPKKDDYESQCPSNVKEPNLGAGETSYKKRISGLFLRKNPSKKKTCAKECPAWDNESTEPGIIKLNSREKIQINLSQPTASTEEIRECMDVRVKDEDGRILYERKDYTAGNNRSSVCGNIYDAKLNRLSTPVMVTNLTSETKQDESNIKDEQSLSNLVEIQFKLRLVHGDKATEINIGKEEDQEEKREEIQNIQEVYSVKNEERDEIIDESSPKDDISIKIIVKNYRPKSGKRKPEKDKLDDYYSKISQKFNTVSTGYSDIYAEATEETENVFSVHRATINLASSTEKSKTYSTASNERSKTHSAASNEKSKIHSAVSNDVDDSVEPIEQEPSNTKSKTSYTVPSLSTEELVLITEDEGIDNPKINLHAYDTHYEYLRETYSNYFNKAHADINMSTCVQKEQETTVAVKSEEKVESISKENSKLAKKELLKKVFQRAHSKPKSKGRVRQLRDMLKIILTDSSTNDDLTMTSNDLAKDVTFTSLKPNYFRDTDSMNNYYKMESTISSLKLKTSLLEPNNYPTKENNSDDTEDDSGKASPLYRGCMCSKLVEKIKDPSLNISCCCRKKTKQDGEMNCDLYEDFNRIETIDAETQKSNLCSKVISNKSTNIPGAVVSKIREFTTNKIEKLISPRTIKQDNQINNEKHEKGRDNIVVTNSEPKRKDKRKTYHYPNAADILQCYEAKKAVLEIYAEKSYSKHGEHLVAKLPKFLYEKESEIERNYDKIATNSYVSVRTENVFMMSVGR